MKINSDTLKASDYIDTVDVRAPDGKRSVRIWFYGCKVNDVAVNVCIDINSMTYDVYLDLPNFRTLPPIHSGKVDFSFSP